MYWALLQLGRRLVLPPDIAAVPAVVTYEEILQYRDLELDVDGRLSVNIMFPATEGTIKRLMDDWWATKVRQLSRSGCAEVMIVAWWAAKVQQSYCRAVCWVDSFCPACPCAGGAAELKGGQAAVCQAQPQSHASELAHLPYAVEVLAGSPA